MLASLGAMAGDPPQTSTPTKESRAMSEAKIADRKPAVLELEAGDYYWCSCGQSAKQPFCDGSHKATSFKPLKVSFDTARKVALCTCKRSAKAPFCDGTHKGLA